MMFEQSKVCSISPRNNACIKMEDIKPLANFPVIATSQIEKAEFCLSQSITDVQIDQVGDRRNFRLEMNAVNLERCSLLYNYFGALTKLTTGADIDYAIFVTGLGIPIKLFVDNEPYLVTQHKGAMIARAKKIRIERPAHSEILYLRVPLSGLWNQFEKLTARHHRGFLIFDRKVNLVEGSGAMLKGLMEYLVDIFTFNESVMKNPAMRGSFDDLLMTAMLSLPHNKRNQLYEDKRNVIAPAVVRRAEEYMQAHLKKPIKISDLIRVCDCSRSLLFSAFRNTRDYTPMEFLTEQRLQHARKELLQLEYNASISSVALNFGFVSNSWFSQVYKKRFGERPIDTLRMRK